MGLKKQETEHPKHRPGAGLHHPRPVLAMCWPASGPTCRSQLLARLMATSSHTEVTLPPHSMGAGIAHSTESAPSSSREQAQQCLQPSQRKRRSSFLGRKQGLVFVGFYARQEKEAQGNNFLLLLTGFFTLFAPLQKKAHQSSRTARSLCSRGTGTTIEDWFPCQYLCSQGASLMVSWIATTQLTGRGIGERAITFT